MPRVEVLVRVISDAGDEASRASFRVSSEIVTNLTDTGLSPEDLVRYFALNFQQWAINSELLRTAGFSRRPDAVTRVQLGSPPPEPRMLTVEDIRRSQVADPDTIFRTEYMGQFSPSEGSSQTSPASSSRDPFDLRKFSRASRLTAT